MIRWDVRSYYSFFSFIPYIIQRWKSLAFHRCHMHFADWLQSWPCYLVSIFIIQWLSGHMCRMILRVIFVPGVGPLEDLRRNSSTMYNDGTAWISASTKQRNTENSVQQLWQQHRRQYVRTPSPFGRIGSTITDNPLQIWPRWKI